MLKYLKEKNNRGKRNARPDQEGGGKKKIRERLGAQRTEERTEPHPVVILVSPPEAGGTGPREGEREKTGWPGGGI